MALAIRNKGGGKRSKSKKSDPKEDARATSRRNDEHHNTDDIESQVHVGYCLFVHISPEIPLEVATEYGGSYDDLAELVHRMLVLQQLSSFSQSRNKSLRRFYVLSIS